MKNEQMQVCDLYVVETSGGKLCSPKVGEQADDCEGDVGAVR